MNKTDHLRSIALGTFIIATLVGLLYFFPMWVVFALLILVTLAFAHALGTLSLLMYGSWIDRDGK